MGEEDTGVHRQQLSASSNGDDVYDHDLVESILDGLYWQHLSPQDSAAMDHLEGIGDLATISLHGEVVHRVLQGAWGGGLPSVNRAKLVSVAASRTICKQWKQKNLSQLLRHETYYGLIRILSDMLEELLRDA